MQDSGQHIQSSFFSNGRISELSGNFLHYEVSFADPYGHYLEVDLSLAEVAAGQIFALPVWIPGSYMVRDFAKHVVRVSAQADGEAVALNMIDKSRWQLPQSCKTLVISLRIFAFDDSVRAAWFDERRAFVNGTSVFLRVEGREDWPCRVTLHPPTHPALVGWRLATMLGVINAPDWGFGDYGADNYHHLVDCPIEAGHFDVYGFEACGVPHVMLFAGVQSAVTLDSERLLADVTSICESHIRRFEPQTQQAPFQRYLFLTHVTAAGYGGLEHRDSTALVCSVKDLPAKGETAATANYRQYLGLCSHEYFHSWNVKRIAPQAFAQPNYQAENYSTQLWAFEGITSYYDDLGVLQAGAMTPAQWLETFGQTVTRVYRGSGRHGQSLVDSSFTTWTRFYQQDANAPNAIVSYYAKGALVALAVDLKLRLLSNGQLTLEDVMRALWQQYGKPQHGLGEAVIESLVVDMAATQGDAVAAEMTEFLEQALRGTQDLPLAALLAEFAVELQWRAASSQSDKGGKEEVAWRVWSGLYVEPVGKELMVRRVDNDSPAHKAGISVGDALIAVNGYRAEQEWLQKQYVQAAPGEQWQLAVFRGNSLMQKSLELEMAPKTTAVLCLMSDASEAALARRQEWLAC